MPPAEYVEGSLWFYQPNKVAALFFLVAFSATTALHLWQCFHYRCFKVTGLFLTCGLLYIGGFAFRVNGAFGDYGNLALFVVSVAFIAISPPLLTLANYHILGRLLHYVPYLSPVNPARVLSTFGFLSIVIELLNALGAAFTANPNASEGNRQAGHDIMWASLALQFLILVCFLGLAGYFHRRCAKAGLAGTRAVQSLLWTLYVSVGLILARTAYRTAEHQEIGPNDDDDDELGNVSALVRLEWIFLVFEASLMLINMCIWNIWHPRRFLPADVKRHLTRDGLNEEMGEAWVDNRSKTAKWLDPLDIKGMYGERREKMEGGIPLVEAGRDS